ncbi:hypothetical protein DFQ29_000369, partial [Apophysomyces sp. BC1021]
MGFLRFLKKRKERKATLPSSPQERSKHLRNHDESPVSTSESAIRSPIADSFMNSSTLSNIEHGNSSFLDDILKDLPSNTPIAATQQHMLRGHMNSDSVVQTSSPSARHNSVLKKREHPASNLSSESMGLGITTLNTVRSTTPTPGPLYTKAENPKALANKTPSKYQLGSVSDSDVSDSEESSLLAPEAPKPQQKPTAPPPELLMARMKERHRQECRRSLQCAAPRAASPPLPPNQYRASPSMHNIHTVDSPQHVMTHPSYSTHSLLPNHLVRSTSAVTDLYHYNSMTPKPENVARQVPILPVMYPPSDTKLPRSVSAHYGISSRSQTFSPAPPTPPTPSLPSPPKVPSVEYNMEKRQQYQPQLTPPTPPPEPKTQLSSSPVKPNDERDEMTRLPLKLRTELSTMRLRKSQYSVPNLRTLVEESYPVLEELLPKKEPALPLTTITEGQSDMKETEAESMPMHGCRAQQTCCMEKEDG